MWGNQKRSTVPQPTHVPQGLQDQQDLLALRYVLQMLYNIEDKTIGLNYTEISNYEIDFKMPSHIFLAQNLQDFKII